MLWCISVWLKHPLFSALSPRKIPRLEPDHGWHITFLLLLDQSTLLWIRQRLSLRAVPYIPLCCCQTHNSIISQGSDPQLLSQARSLSRLPCTAEPSTSAQGQTEVQAFVPAASLEATWSKRKCSNRATRNEQRDEFIFFLSVICLLKNK